MEVYQRLVSRLRPLRLYRLDGSTLVDAELFAYAAGLSLLEEELLTLEREAFVATARDYGLSLRERLFGSVKTALPLEDRREMLLYRGGVTAADCTRQGVERAMAASGIRCSIGENRKDGLLYINCIAFLNPFADQQSVIRAAQESLPAHLSVLFDFRALAWDDIDQRDLSFDTMEAAGLSWDQIDQFKEEIVDADQS